MSGRSEKLNRAARGGALIGVGLGPGDPELMTLKAARLIGSADIIAYPVLEAGSSLARVIAAGVISKHTKEIAIEIPMTIARAPAQAAYDAGAERIAKALRGGTDVIYLCEGDPFFYGSFMYLFTRLSGDFTTEIVPGVTSFSAGSALSRVPLAARNDVLTVLPAPLQDAVLRARLTDCDAAVIMKLGRHFPRVRALLKDMGLVNASVYVERATMVDSKVMALTDAPEEAPYFSMILVSKGADPWL